MKWETYKLKQLCSEIVDCVNKTAPTSDVSTPYKMLRTSDIRDGKINLENLNCVTKEVYEKWTRRGKLQKGDVIFTREAPLGEVGLVREEKNYFLGQRLVLFRANNKMCDGRFLMYSLLWHDNKQAIISKGVGSTVAHLRVPECENIEIKVPDLDAQHRIADILSAYDDLIENNQKQIKLLEEAAQRLYKEWFVDLRFPGHENTKIVDGVPEGWNECTVENFGTVITGKTPPTSNKEYYTNGKVPFVTIPDMHNVVYPLKTEKRLTIEGAQTQKNKYIPPNSVMISCIGTVGLVSIATEVCQTNQQINSIILNNEDDLYFFYESMLRMKDLLDGLGSNGATMTNVNKSKLEKLIIISPSKDIVKQYNDVCKPLFESALNLSRKNVYLKNMREGLLPKLMSGEAEI